VHLGHEVCEVVERAVAEDFADRGVDGGEPGLGGGADAEDELLYVSVLVAWRGASLVGAGWLCWE
jgi:hypothetical protein